MSKSGVGSPEVLCVSKPGSFRFVTDVLTEVMALFPSPEIHIGGDECAKERWKACPVCQARIKGLGLADETALQNEFTRRLTAFLQTKGWRLQGWNEVEEGGPLPRTVVVQLWNNPVTLARSAGAGRDIVFSYTPFLYLDQDPAGLTLERICATEPLPANASPAERRHLLGLEACLWTERRDGDATTDDYLWPRVAGLAEAAWSPVAVRDWADFRRRLVAAHLDRMARVSLGAGVPGPQIARRRRHLYDTGELAVGREAGRWDPSMMSESPVTRDWEITKLLTRPGAWRAQPVYTSGAHAMEVHEIALIRRDATGRETILATDTHEGWAGTAVQNTRYRLPVPARDPSARYFLRVHLRSDGGTDSQGMILLYAPEK